MENGGAKIDGAAVSFLKSKAFQPCFNLFSIVIQEDVNILRTLPQRLRYFLKVSSSMLPDEKINLSQLSVSIHSLRAISNFESISARLWGYCASETFAKTLDEDFLIWYEVLESILLLLQSAAISQANFSEYSNNKFFAISFSFRISITPKACMESSTCCGMESRHSRVLNQAAGRCVCTLARDAIRLRRFHTMRKRIDSIPSLRLG